MASIDFRTAAFVIASTLLIGVGSTAQEAGRCKAEITSPKRGDPVNTSGDVRGTATVPPGMFLWVFAQREGLARWWPQSGGAARIRDGEWVVHAVYGDERIPVKTRVPILSSQSLWSTKKPMTRLSNTSRSPKARTITLGWIFPRRIPDVLVRTSLSKGGRCFACRAIREFLWACGRAARDRAGVRRSLPCRACLELGSFAISVGRAYRDRTSPTVDCHPHLALSIGIRRHAGRSWQRAPLCCRRAVWWD